MKGCDKMAFQVSYEAVEVMENLAQKLPGIVDDLLNANKEVLECYEEVKNTVGPHSKQIEKIVRDVDKGIRKNMDDINTVAKGLKVLANRCQTILMKKNFRDDLKIGFTPTVSLKTTNNNSSDEAPALGQRTKQICNQTEYEH